MNKIKYFIVGIFILLILVASGAFFSGHFSKPPVIQPQIYKVKIGYMPFTTNWPVFLASEGGLFKKEGLDVTLVKFNSGVLGADALIKGDIAAFSINTFTDIFNIQARTPGAFQIYTLEQSSNSDHGEALIVRKDSNIKTIQNLKGKKIGINPGTFVEAVIKQAYKDELNFSKDATLIKISPPLQLQALQSGQIDALLAQEPSITLALKTNMANILDSHPWGKVAEPFPVGGVTLSTKVIQSNPDIINKIAKAFKASILLGRSNPQEIKNAVLRFVKLSPDEIAQLNYDEELVGEELKLDTLSNAAKLYYDLGITTSLVDTKNMLYVLKNN